MSTPFDVRRWAEQAGIHTTGGFSVVAECVTLDELQRFADIAIATAAKHWQRAHAITALEALENAQDQLAKPYSTEASKAITALRAALAEPNKCTHGVTDGNCKECYMAEPDQEPLTEEEIEQAYRHIWRNLPENFDHTSIGWIEQGIRYAEQTHGIGEKK